MKKRNLIAIGAAAVLLAACIPSVNPFYTDKDVVGEPRLLGEWLEKGNTNDPEVWTFEQATNKLYTLKIVQKGKTGEFTACLFKLKQEQFLDLVPNDCNYASNQVDLVGACMFPGHLLVRVPQVEPNLQLSFFDFDWLEKYLETNSKAIAHRLEPGRGMVLTADTGDLQKFVLKHCAGTNELFKAPDEMVRRTP